MMEKSAAGEWQVVGLGNVRELADLLEERNPDGM